MTITSRCSRPTVAALLALVLLAQSAWQAPRLSAQMDPLTVGAVLGAAVAAKALVDSMITHVGDEAKGILNDVNTLLTDLINRITGSYQGMLDMTLAELDEALRTDLLRLYTLVQKVQTDLQIAAGNLNDLVLADLKKATADARLVLAHSQDVVVVAAMGASFMIRKAVFDGMFVASAVLLGIGLLVFMWLMIARGLPVDARARVLALGSFAAFVILFGALLLPPVRGTALAWSGFASEVKPLTAPQIFDVSPSTIVLGRTSEILLVGARLAPTGQLPGVQVAGVDAPVVGGNETLAVSIPAAALASKLGTQSIRVTTSDGQVSTASVTIVAKRPLPRLIAWSITPTGPRWDSGGDFTRTDIGCRAPAPVVASTKECTFDTLIVVQPPFALDVNRPAQLGVRADGHTLSNSGTAVAGFRETIVTFTPRSGQPRDPERHINYYPNLTNPTGIQVTGSARNDARQFGGGGKRGEFKASYSVYGRRLNAHATTAAWTFHGTCEVSGTVICGTYPAANDLHSFSGTPNFVTSATFVGADGMTVPVSGSLIPDDATSFLSVPLVYEQPGGTLSTAAITLRISHASVSVSGPSLGSVSAPPVAPYLTRIVRDIERRSSLPRRR